MKLTVPVFGMLSAAFAAATPKFSQNVTLSVESTDSTIDGNGLTNIHFGAGINGVLLTNSTVTYQYDADSKQVATIIPVNGGEQYAYSLSQLGDDLIAGVTGAPFALVQGDYLAINGSTSVFYACTKLSYDPYGYLSKSNGHGVGVYASEAPSVCEPIKIKVSFD